MVAMAFPGLELPAVTALDVVRLAWWIGELRYGDALITANLRLERQHIQAISDAEDDGAADGTLVSGNYIEFLVFKSYLLYGVVEARSVRESKRRTLRHALARCLLANGWQVDGTRLEKGGALTPPNRKLGRVRRLLKGQG